MILRDLSTLGVSEAIKAFKIRNGLKYIQDGNVSTMAKEVQQILGNVEQDELKNALEAYTKCEIDTNGKLLCTRMIVEIHNAYKSKKRSEKRERQNRYDENRKKDWRASDKEKNDLLLNGFHSHYEQWKIYNSSGFDSEEMPYLVGLYTLYSFALGNDLFKNINPTKAQIEERAKDLETIHRGYHFKLHGFKVERDPTGENIERAALITLLFDEMLKNQSNENNILSKLRR